MQYQSNNSELLGNNIDPVFCSIEDGFTIEQENSSIASLHIMEDNEKYNFCITKINKDVLLLCQNSISKEECTVEDSQIKVTNILIIVEEDYSLAIELIIPTMIISLTIIDMVGGFNSISLTLSGIENSTITRMTSTVPIK